MSRRPARRVAARGISRLAPPRFLLFLALFAVGVGGGIAALGWRGGTMAGFDLAALGFILACLPLFDDDAAEMRRAARRNDANRVMLLGITALVMIVILVAVAAELQQQGTPDPLHIALIIATLALSWGFSNLVYALHYAHLFYSEGEGEGASDHGGLKIPGVDEPDYWDFLYFSATLGMTFQTSDIDIESRRIRRTSIFHCLAAFAFNIGVLAFTINVLGGG